MFLEKLKKELLNENTRIAQLPKKFSDFLLYLRASEPSTYELLKNYTDYYWMSPTPKMPNPTMGVAMKGGRLQFYIGKAFYSSLSLSQLAFLMYHELAHYKRGHCNHNFNLGKSNHDVANITEDIYINEDANRDGNFAGVPLKFVDGVLMKETGTYKGATSNGIDQVLSKFLGIKEPVDKSEYMSINDSATLYKYLMKKFKNKQPEDDKEGDGEKQEGEEQEGGQPQKITPKKGDIIRGPDGQYGRVSKVSGGRVTEVDALSKEEAEKIVKGIMTFASLLAKVPKMPIDIS